MRAQCLQQEAAVPYSPAHTAHQRPAGAGLWEYLHNGLPSQWGKSDNFAFNDISMQMAHVSAFQQRSSPITFILRATKYCDCKCVYIKDCINRSTKSRWLKKNTQACSAFTILLLAELGVVHSAMYSKNTESAQDAGFLGSLQVAVKV